MPIEKEIYLANFKGGLSTDKAAVGLGTGDFAELENFYLQAGKLRTRPPCEIFPLRSGTTWGFGDVKGFQMVGGQPVLIRPSALSTFDPLNGQCVDLEAAVMAFSPQGQTSRAWSGLAASSDGDVYSSVSVGDIYERDAGAGDFLALSQTTRTWASMCADPVDGDIYACVSTTTVEDTSNVTGNSFTSGDTPTGTPPVITWNPATQDSIRTFTMDALAAPVATITGVTTHASVRNYGYSPGNTVTYNHVCRSAGTNYFSSAKLITFGGSASSDHTWATDPATGIAWTVAGLNAATFGVKVNFDTDLSQWFLLAFSRTNNYGTPGDIYKQTAGAGAFAALSQTARAWTGLGASPSGDIYASVTGGDIYMQAAGAGAFAALSQTSRLWRGICGAPSGDVYCCVYGGDIYKQTAGVGNFVALSQTSRNWIAMAADPASGDIYACVQNGDIYKRVSGAGNFIPLGQVNRAWSAMAVAADGAIYAAVNGGDIYVLSGGGFEGGTPQSIQYKNFGYAAVGGGIIKFNTTNYWNLGVAPPAAAPAIADGAAGAVEAGAMIGIYTFVDAEGVESPVSPISNTLSHTVSKKVAWTNIEAALDTRVVARRLYRTLPNQTGEYFLVATIENNTDTTYEENTTVPEMSDLADIYKQRYSDLTDDGALDLATVFERLWATDGKYVLGSLPEEPEYFDPENIYAFSPDDGESIKAVEALPGMLVVLKEGSVWALDQSLGFFEFLPRLVDNSAGCAYTASAASSGKHVFFVSKNVVYKCDGRSPAQDISTGRLDLRTKLGSTACGVVFRKRGWYILFTEGKGGDSAIFVYDYLRDYWFNLSYGKTITDGVNTAAIMDPEFFAEGLNSAGGYTIYSVLNATAGDRGTITDLFDEEAPSGVGAPDEGIGDAVNAVAAADNYDISDEKILSTAQFKAIDWEAPGAYHTISRTMISCTDPVESVTYPDANAQLLASVSVIREDGRVSAKTRTDVDISGTRQWKNIGLSARDRKVSQSALKITRNSRWPIDIEGIKILGELWDAIPRE